MSILDRSHDRPTGLSRVPAVRTLDLNHGERIRLTIEARTAALDAASRILAPVRPAVDNSVLLGRAAMIEAWILREDRPEEPR